MTLLYSPEQVADESTDEEPPLLLAFCLTNIYGGKDFILGHQANERTGKFIPWPSKMMFQTYVRRVLEGVPGLTAEEQEAPFVQNASFKPVTIDIFTAFDSRRWSARNANGQLSNGFERST